MQFDLGTPSLKTSPDGSAPKTMLSDVSWERLSEAMAPSFRANGLDRESLMMDGDGLPPKMANKPFTPPNGQALVWLPGLSAGRHGGFSMLNISAYPNDGSAC